MSHFNTTTNINIINIYNHQNSSLIQLPILIKIIIIVPRYNSDITSKQVSLLCNYNISINCNVSYIIHAKS